MSPLRTMAPSLEMNFDDLAVDARLHRHLRDRRDVAEQINANRNLLLDRLRDVDRDRAAFASWLSALARRHPAATNAPRIAA